MDHDCRRLWRRASGVWLLAATDDVSAAARVDGSGRRIALDVEWLRANGLGRVTGFLVGATRQGVLLVDVRQAEFQKSGR